MGFVVLFLCGYLSSVMGRPVDDEVLSGRSPISDSPAAVTAEAALQFLLRNDQDMCLLKLVCGAGANVSRYGVYADSIASSLGYKYEPFDFNVVRSPNLAEKLKIVGRDAFNDLDGDTSGRQGDGDIFIGVPKLNSNPGLDWAVRISPSYVNKPVNVWKTRPMLLTPQMFVNTSPFLTPSLPLHRPIAPAPAIAHFSSQVLKPVHPFSNLFPAFTFVAKPPLPFFNVAALSVIDNVRGPSFTVIKSRVPVGVTNADPLGNQPASPLTNVMSPKVASFPQNKNSILVSDGSRSLNTTDFDNNGTLGTEIFIADEDYNLTNTAEIISVNSTVAPDFNQSEETNLTIGLAPEASNVSVALEKRRGTIGMENTVELEDRSGFPATYVFNRAFSVGLRSGSEACTKTFGECPMNVDRIVRFGSSLFMSPPSISDNN